MRRINKGPEPRGFAQYRLSTPGAHYDGAPKDELRRALLAEQGYVCCYCMRRIDETSTRIEHRLPRANHSDEALNYRNMLAACPGGEGLDDELQHCDVHKKSHEISIDPVSQDVEQLLHYTSGGAIGAGDERFHKDVDVTLNLNLHWLKEARREALEGFLAGFRRRHAKEWSRDVIERELRKWTEIPAQGRVEPHAGIVVSYLRRRLRQARSS
jgi:uncharacterized protein (TIGR02646 family)